jgi:hypothetical protein
MRKLPLVVTTVCVLWSIAPVSAQNKGLMTLFVEVDKAVICPGEIVTASVYVHMIPGPGEPIQWTWKEVLYNGYVYGMTLKGFDNEAKTDGTQGTWSEMKWNTELDKNIVTPTAINNTVFNVQLKNLAGYPSPSNPFFAGQ